MALPFHVPEKFRAGERVTVVAEVYAAEAWHGTYSPFSTGMLGKTGKIQETNPLWGYYVVVTQGKSHLTSWFPSCALDKPTKQNVVIEVPSI